MFFKLTAGSALLVVISIGLWLRQPDGRLPGKIVEGIVFSDENHGYVQLLTLEHPEVYETYDGGKTWKPAGAAIPGFRRGRSFATKLKGWSIDEKSVNEEPSAYNTAQSVYQTDDGGKTWYSCFKSLQKGDFVFGGLQALSENEAWVIGISGAYRTTDGGKTWQKSGPPGTGIQFRGPNGWILDDPLWHSSDGGHTWQPISAKGKTCLGGYDFFFLDEHNGWAVSGQTGSNEGNAQTGYVTVTFDGGTTCDDLPSISNQILHAVFFLNQKQGWVGGAGSLLRTEDGGQTWTNLTAK